MAYSDRHSLLDARIYDFLYEVEKRPYPDSDLASLLETLRAQATRLRQAIDTREADEMRRYGEQHWG